jgi:hypothetical protein|eukprot:7381823-Prymnesium_polylepis.2
MYSLRATYIDGHPETTAHIVDADGNESAVPYAALMEIMERSRPAIETPIEQLETDVIGLLLLLFQHNRAHPVVLDGKDIGTQIGNAPESDYFHYINGHVLNVDSANTQCVYQSLTYVDYITPQETVWIKDTKVVGITIHDFMSTSPPRIEPQPGNPRFHGQLNHVRDSLEQAVLRIIYDTPYDGENAVAADDIARGATQFVAAVY